MTLDVLVSPAIFSEKAILAILEEFPEWNVVLDSGAFTNFKKGKDVITLDWFAGFLREHGDRFTHYFNLDVIGDHAASMARLRALQDQGLSPVPVFQRGGSVEDLQGLLDAFPLVGIGGIAGTLNRKGDREYLHRVMRAVGPRRKQVHLLGVGQQDILLDYRPFSADVSSGGYRAQGFGMLELWNGTEWVRFTRKKSIRPDIDRSRALASYDLEWRDLARMGAWRENGDRAAGIASVRGWMRYANTLRRMGVRLVLVLHPRIMKSFRDAWRLEA